jgi:diaminohydroxyphosphoribosylaminopyrimidine deaminase/5-amino-6-(5-phosphoribosylamino)uracil reductase
LRDDDPALTVRLEGYRGPQPRPVVIAGTGRLPAQRVVYDRDPLIFVPALFADPPAGAIRASAEGGGTVDLAMVLDHLGSRGIVDVLVEGGPTLAGALLADGLVDRLVVYLGAKVAGGQGRGMFHSDFPTLSAARDAVIADIRRLGPDVRLDIELPVMGARV